MTCSKIDLFNKTVKPILFILIYSFSLLEEHRADTIVLHPAAFTVWGFYLRFTPCLFDVSQLFVHAPSPWIDRSTSPSAWCLVDSSLRSWRVMFGWWLHSVCPIHRHFLCRMVSVIGSCPVLSVYATTLDWRSFWPSNAQDISQTVVDEDLFVV